MEVKINKEIRDYTESVYFGLSLRQFIFSLLACIMAVILYFIFRPFCGMEALSWICIIGALPFATIGFIKYNGMNLEDFITAYLKTEILVPKKLLFKPINLYEELMKNVKGDEKIENNRKIFKKR